MDFLLSTSSEAEPSRCPLPILITQENKWRWHPYDGKVDYHIYKFRHEVPNGPKPRDHCDIDETDWPEVFEQQEIETEMDKKMDGEDCDEERIIAARERMKQIVTPTSRIHPKRFWNEEEMSRLQPDPKKQGRSPYFFDP